MSLSYFLIFIICFSLFSFITLGFTHFIYLFKEKLLTLFIVSIVFKISFSPACIFVNFFFLWVYVVLIFQLLKVEIYWQTLSTKGLRSSFVLTPSMCFSCSEP